MRTSQKKIASKTRIALCPTVKAGELDPAVKSMLATFPNVNPLAMAHNLQRWALQLELVAPGRTATMEQPIKNRRMDKEIAKAIKGKSTYQKIIMANQFARWAEQIRGSIASESKAAKKGGAL